MQVIADPKLAPLGLDKLITGTKDSEIASSILFSGIKAIEPILPATRDAAGQLSNGFNIIAQSLHDFQPQDAMEARLVAQAVALYQHGMDRLGRAGRSDLISHSEAQANMAIKLLRVHNETIEALHRYRRGGEQKVIVQHVTVDKAIVNNFSVGGGASKNRGDNPCPESAVQKPDPVAIDHVVSPQWQTEDADCMEAYVPGPKLKKADSA